MNNNDCLNILFKMTNYIKLFETTSQYEEYINGSDVVFPNVSVAKDAPKTVYYNIAVR